MNLLTISASSFIGFVVTSWCVFFHFPLTVSASISSFAANRQFSDEQIVGDDTNVLISHPRQHLRKLKGKNKSSKDSNSIKDSKSSKKKSKKSKSSKLPNISLDCYLLDEGLGEDQTAPPPEECTPLYDSILSLQDGSFPREDFQDFFNQFLLPGIENFINKNNILMADPIVNIELAIERLEQYFFDGVPLNPDDFAQLLAQFPSPPATSPDVVLAPADQSNGETPEAIAAYYRDHASKRSLSAYASQDSQMEQQLSSMDSMAVAPFSPNRALIDDNELTPECLDVIVRIVIEVIGLFLSALGIRGIILRPFKAYFVSIKGGQLNGLVLTAYRQSRGEFDASFFAGLVVSFLSILTWDDIKAALGTLDSDDWLSLALGLGLAIASVFATGGLAISFAITSIVIQADSLRGDIQDLGQCFRLCSDGFAQSGGQQTTTYTVILDRSKGKLTLYYQMYGIPDQLDLIYEGVTIFTTGGLVSGSQTIERDIDGEAEEILVRITAPNSGTAWNFRLDCPVPNIF